MAMNTRGSCSAKRLIKCFCDCALFTEDDIKRIYRLSALETLKNEESSKLFRSFLEKESTAIGGDASEALRHLDIFQRSEILLSKKDSLVDDEDIEYLSELGLPYDKERLLTQAVRIENLTDIRYALHSIQEECTNEIEISQDFKRYKEAVLRKIQK